MDSQNSFRSQSESSDHESTIPVDMLVGNVAIRTFKQLEDHKHYSLRVQVQVME